LRFIALGKVAPLPAHLPFGDFRLNPLSASLSPPPNPFPSTSLRHCHLPPQRSGRTCPKTALKPRLPGRIRLSIAIFASRTIKRCRQRYRCIQIISQARIEIIKAFAARSFMFDDAPAK
jgi:hypothetical protein